MMKNAIAIEDIAELPTPGVSWEMEGADATYAGKVAVIVIVAILIL